MIPDFVSDRELAQNLCFCVARIAAEYGLGYRDTAYSGLLAAEFLEEGMNCISDPPANIYSDRGHLGQTKLHCLAVEKRCAILVLSLRDDIQATDRAILQTYLRHLGFEWGLVVHFGKRDLKLRWVSAPSRSSPAPSLNL